MVISLVLQVCDYTPHSKSKCSSQKSALFQETNFMYLFLMSVHVLLVMYQANYLISLLRENERDFTQPFNPRIHCLYLFFLFAVQPMKLGEHLNSLLLNMCDDVTVSRMSLRTVLDICSKHIRNSNCDPPFSYIRKLVRLVLGSLSQVHILLMYRRSNTTFLCFKKKKQLYFRCFPESLHYIFPVRSRMKGLSALSKHSTLVEVHNR